jgi:hypothetical protein
MLRLAPTFRQCSQRPTISTTWCEGAKWRPLVIAATA